MFKASEFKDGKHYTAADKAKFANQYAKFAKGGFQRKDFPKWFYTRLSNCFGHIAHYNQEGFYATWFQSLDQQIKFIQQAVVYPCYGQPEHTFCDVERALIAWLDEDGILQELEKRVATRG